MPTPAYMTVEGATQGNITQGASTEDSVGNVWQEDHQPTGQRSHKPVTVTKVFDKSSPLLYNALCRGELLPKVEIKWYRTSAAGTQEHYFTISLIDAVCVDIQGYMPNCQDPDNAAFTHLEDVSFSYRSIEWTHEVASTTGSDDWRAPVV